ncbi:MAG: helix-turn-helix domain-containing protein [Gemmatirosa sp.]
MPLRLALLAAAPAVRTELESSLADRPGLVVVGAGSIADDQDAIEAAFDRVAEWEPDVVVWVVERASAGSVDDLLRRAGVAPAVSPVGGEGVSPVGASEREGLPAAAVVLLVDRVGEAAPPRALVLSALRAGARAVLSLDADATTLALAVESAAAGLVVLPADVAGTLLGGGRRDRSPGGRGDAGAPGRVPALSGREREVLALLAEGLPNKVIAPRLGISEHTVKAHVTAIFEKLGTGTRAEAVVTAARLGLLLL